MVEDHHLCPMILNTAWLLLCTFVYIIACVLIVCQVHWFTCVTQVPMDHSRSLVYLCYFQYTTWFYNCQDYLAHDHLAIVNCSRFLNAPVDLRLGPSGHTSTRFGPSVLTGTRRSGLIPCANSFSRCVIHAPMFVCLCLGNVYSSIWSVRLLCRCSRWLPVYRLKRKSQIEGLSGIEDAVRTRGQPWSRC